LLQYKKSTIKEYSKFQFTEQSRHTTFAYFYLNSAPFGYSFLLGVVRFEPLAVQLSGGQLLPPVQKLVATLIFAHMAKMQIESTIPSKDVCTI